MTEDTVVDFDDMAHSVPRRSLRASVAKMKFISLHQSHVYREEEGGEGHVAIQQDKKSNTMSC